MKRDHSITLASITNFLDAGALLRHRDQWILIEGPFRPSIDPKSDEITVFHPHFYDSLSSHGWHGQQTYELSSEHLKAMCDEYLQTQDDFEFPMSKSPWLEPEKQKFSSALTTIQDKISQGVIQKAVPVIFASSQQSVTAAERAQIIRNLISAPESLYVYGFWQNGEGVLGATPETLFSYQSGTLKTMALAGTCPKSEMQERESLLSDSKEMQEHALVLEDIKEVLSSLGSVVHHGPYIVELPTLYHLKTDIEVQCKVQPNFMSLLKQLHPTPALGVAPRSFGYQWMQSLPGQEMRGGYGAPFGFFSKNEALCLVSIRNLQWNKSIAMIGSGCGIVKASQLDREWTELFQKRLSVRIILGLEI